MMAVGAIICRHKKLTADSLHLLFQDKQLLCPRADDGDDFVPHLMKGLGYGVDRGNAHAASYADHGSEFLYMARFPEGPHHVQHRLVKLKLAEFSSRCPNFLEDNRYGAFLPVKIGNCKRNPLRTVVAPQHHKLPRLHPARYLGHIELPELERWLKLLVLHNLVHPGSHFLVRCLTSLRRFCHNLSFFM